MYSIVTTNRLDKDLRIASKRGKNLSKIHLVMKLLADGEPLLPRHRDHALMGDYVARRECHIESDWLLIYKIDETRKEIIFERTGTHSDLF